MKRLYRTLANDLSVIIMPDIVTHMDGHPVLSYSYNIFLNTNKNEVELVMQENNVPQRQDDPTYYGHIVFESPGRLFSYHEGNMRLTRDEVEEVIEYISHVRDNPKLWRTENL